MVKEQRLPAEISFTLPGFSVNDWLAHFMCIFNYPIVNVSFGRRDEWMYSADSVRKLLEGFSIGELVVAENVCEIIKQFRNMNSLQLMSTALEPQLSETDSNFIKKVLIGNIASLRIYRVIPIDLNTLLTMNCPDIGIRRNSITEKELNMFLKLWSKCAGPNLREIDIDLLHQVRNGLHLDHSVILKGIKAASNDDNVFGSKYTIWKRDGTHATLFVSPISLSFLVQL